MSSSGGNVNHSCHQFTSKSRQSSSLGSNHRSGHSLTSQLSSGISSIQRSKGLTLKLSCPRTTSVREDHKVTLALSQVHNLRLSNLSALQGLCKYSSHSRNRQRLIQFLPKKLKTKKTYIKVLKMKLKSKRPVNHALRGPKALLSSRRSGSVIRAAGIVPMVSQSPRPWSCGASLSLMSCRQMT